MGVRRGGLGNIYVRCGGGRYTDVLDGEIMLEEVSKWGGKREGSGRPKGSKNTVERPLRPTRPQRPQMRAFDDEWELIKAFEKIVKKGDKQAAREFVLKYAMK